MAQFQFHAWVRRNIAHVPCLHAVLSHNPELIADASIANGSPARIPWLATDSLEQRIPWWRDIKGKQPLDRRIQPVLLQRMHNPMFHWRAKGDTVWMLNQLLFWL